MSVIAPLTVQQRVRLNTARRAEQKLRLSAKRTAKDTTVRDIAIRAAVEVGVRPVELARGLGLSPQRIQQIVKGAQ